MFEFNAIKIRTKEKRTQMRYLDQNKMIFLDNFNRQHPIYQFKCTLLL